MSHLNPASPDALFRLITATWISQAIYAAAKLRIADELAEGALTVDRLAAQTHTHAPSLYRLMRALVGIGIFRQNEAGAFELTPLAEYLRSDHPSRLRDAAVLFGEPWHWAAWGGILYSLQTGENNFTRINGMGLLDFFDESPEAGRLFQSTFSHAQAVPHPLLTSFNFSPFSTVVYIGGEAESALFQLLLSYPHLRGIWYGASALVEAAGGRIAELGIGDRCIPVGGDYFEQVPSGADIYVLEHVLRDWDDESARAILQNVRRAMPDTGEGRLLLIETVLPDDDSSFISMWLDLEWLVMVGGKERTKSEYRDLLESAGFELLNVNPITTLLPASVIETAPR